MGGRKKTITLWAMCPNFEPTHDPFPTSLSCALTHPLLLSLLNISKTCLQTKYPIRFPYTKKKPLPCPSSVPNDSPETPSSSTAHHNPSKAAAIPSSPPLGLCGYIDLLGESKEDSLHSAQGNWEGQERAGMLRSHNTFPVSQRFVVEH